MREHATAAPVVGLGDGVVAVTPTGTLDGARVRAVTRTLLEAVVAQRARCAILDVTGVSAVDSRTARRLLEAALAVRLTGAECVVCGIRPDLARTLVRPGAGPETLVTRTSLADALAYALRRPGAQRCG
ncbi:STAS domain-containing protein [Streptomyces seoulensis]